MSKPTRTQKFVDSNNLKTALRIDVKLVQSSFSSLACLASPRFERRPREVAETRRPTVISWPQTPSQDRPTANHSFNPPARSTSVQSLPSAHSPAYSPVRHPARVRPTVRLGAQSRQPVHPSVRPRARAPARPTIRVSSSSRSIRARPLILLPFRPTLAGQHVLIFADDNRRVGDAFCRLLDILAIRRRQLTGERRAFAPVSATASAAAAAAAAAPSGQYWIVHQLSSDSLLPSKRATVRTRPRYPAHSRGSNVPARWWFQMS